jgi:hypothetical protein
MYQVILFIIDQGQLPAQKDQSFDDNIYRARLRPQITSRSWSEHAQPASLKERRRIIVKFVIKGYHLMRSLGGSCAFPSSSRSRLPLLPEDLRY